MVIISSGVSMILLSPRRGYPGAYVWRRLWPGCAKNFRGFKDVVPIVKEIVNLTKKAGFNEGEEASVSQVFESLAEMLTNEDLKQLEMQSNCRYG